MIGVPGAFAATIRAVLESPYSFEKTVKIFATTLVPFLVLYFLLFFLNRFLIRRFGTRDLTSHQRAVLAQLVDATITDRSVPLEPTSLVEEEAWASLKEYWRGK